MTCRFACAMLPSRNLTDEQPTQGHAPRSNEGGINPPLQNQGV
jgi:hypothetical protein